MFWYQIRENLLIKTYFVCYKKNRTLLFWLIGSYYPLGHRSSSSSFQFYFCHHLYTFSDFFLIHSLYFKWFFFTRLDIISKFSLTILFLTMFTLVMHFNLLRNFIAIFYILVFYFSVIVQLSLPNINI